MAAILSVVCSPEWCASRALTVLVPPFSSIAAGSRYSVNPGVASPSTMVSVRAAGAVTPVPAVIVAPTCSVSGGSSASSSTAVITTRPRLDLSPAEIVSARFRLRLKSVVLALPGVVATASSTSFSSAVFSAAVTMLWPAFSPTMVRDSSSVRPGAASSSAMVRVRAAGAVRPGSPAIDAVTSTVSAGSRSSSSTAAIVTTPLLPMRPAGMVSTLSVCLMSAAVAGASGVAVTTSVTGPPGAAPFTAAVTVAEPSASPIRASESVSETVGADCASRMVRVSGSAGAISIPIEPGEAGVPVTRTLRSPV